jgi:hypothetical protein
MKTVVGFLKAQLKINLNKQSKTIENLYQSIMSQVRGSKTINIKV